MSVRLFYDPQRVEQLQRRGIDPANRPVAPPARPTPRAAPVPGSPVEARVAIGLVEECARLRAEVARLRTDNQRLEAEVKRLSNGKTWPGKRDALPADDAAARLSSFDLDP